MIIALKGETQVPKGVYSRQCRDEAERFWEKVDRTENDCWLWTGALWGGGYGLFSVRIRQGRYRSVPAHRWAYEHVVGPIPDGMDIDHLCRNRRCVNPAHLEPVTRRENILRGVSQVALHAAATHCPAGHPYNEQNTWVSKAGHRQCRICDRERKREQTKQNDASGLTAHGTKPLYRMRKGILP